MLQLVCPPESLDTGLALVLRLASVQDGAAVTNLLQVPGEGEGAKEGHVCQRVSMRVYGDVAAVDTRVPAPGRVSVVKGSGDRHVRALVR